ncbi:translation initiation factor IF-2-like [Phyllostomus hastatus]|uniref:translation initiation factor IF-2-like n=1 Tax=Phyllostomus hastatus TaxID=9423 RepID=UPI001E67F6D2|nr:translation initiation factor IF-2-like [Phyllostomus hastatus]
MVGALQAADFPGATKPASGAALQSRPSATAAVKLSSPAAGTLAHSRPKRCLALPAKEALTIKNVNMFAFNPQRSPLPRGSRRTPEPCVGLRRPQRGCRGGPFQEPPWPGSQPLAPRSPRTPLSISGLSGLGPGSPGHDDRGGEDRLGRAPTFQTRRPRPQLRVKTPPSRLRASDAPAPGNCAHFQDVETEAWRFN